jgi:hypothetical protein
MRGVFRHDRDKAAGAWRELHNEKRYNSYSYYYNDRKKEVKMVRKPEAMRNLKTYAQMGR